MFKKKSNKKKNNKTNKLRQLSTYNKEQYRLIGPNEIKVFAIEKKENLMKLTLKH